MAARAKDVLKCSEHQECEPHIPQHMPIIYARAVAQGAAQGNQYQCHQATGRGNQHTMDDRGAVHGVQMLLFTDMHDREGGSGCTDPIVATPRTIRQAQLSPHGSQESAEWAQHLRHYDQRWQAETGRGVCRVSPWARRRGPQR